MSIFAQQIQDFSTSYGKVASPKKSGEEHSNQIRYSESMRGVEFCHVVEEVRCFDQLFFCHFQLFVFSECFDVDIQTLYHKRLYNTWEFNYLPFQFTEKLKEKVLEHGWIQIHAGHQRAVVEEIQTAERITRWIYRWVWNINCAKIRRLFVLLHTEYEMHYILYYISNLLDAFPIDRFCSFLVYMQASSCWIISHVQHAHLVITIWYHSHLVSVFSLPLWWVRSDYHDLNSCSFICAVMPQLFC